MIPGPQGADGWKIGRRFMLAAAISALPVAGVAAATRRRRLTVSVAEFGATGDGRDAERDTAAFLKALKVGRGGKIEVPRGRYLLNPDVLALPEATVLEGAGYGTVLMKAADGCLLSFEGPRELEHVRHSTIRDLRLSGEKHKGPLLRVRFADNLLVDNTQFVANNDTAVEMVECWDSRFRDCIFEWCGGPSSSPAVHIRNTPPNPYGQSRDNSNQIHFVGCRWEQFRDGALWIGDPREGNVANGIYLVNCKMETSHLNGAIMRAFVTVRGLFVQNLYLAVNAFGDMAPGAGKIDLLHFRSVDMASITNAHIYTAVPVRSDLRLVSCGRVAISNLFHDGAAAPVHALVDIDDDRHRNWISNVSLSGPGISPTITVTP
jgi:hypothetical protein